LVIKPIQSQHLQWNRQSKPEIIMAIKIKPENVELGDIITFTREDGHSYLARVMGLSNQELEIVDNQVIYKDGKETMTESGISKDEMFEYPVKVRGQNFNNSRLANIEKRTIPTGHIVPTGIVSWQL